MIRVRAETDQFLLACVELETFVQWLDALFAALSVAAPLDERDFPRDQSIPRLQRVRWYTGRDRESEAIRDRERNEERERESERESEREGERESDHEIVDGGNSSADDEAADVISPLPAPPMSRPISPSESQSKSVRAGQSLAAAAAVVLAEETRIEAPAGPGVRTGSVSSNASSISLDTTSSASTAAGPSMAPIRNLGALHQAAARAMLSPGNPSPDNVVSVSGNDGNKSTGGRFSLRSIRSRLNLNSSQANGSRSGNHGTNNPILANAGPVAYRHEAVNAATGKWQPSHRWTKTHDMVYAKLCYATLLFRSPRKSNYIVMRGKQWLVDWTTGNMVRVSPPRYGEIEAQPGPWQALRIENSRI